MDHMKKTTHSTINSKKIKLILLVTLIILSLFCLIFFQQTIFSKKNSSQDLHNQQKTDTSKSSSNSNSSNNSTSSQSSETVSSSSLLKNGKFSKMIESDIKPSTEKVNFYVFWGDGCSHCEALASFLNANSSSLKEKINIYSFEIWDNKENKNFMKDFGKFLNENPKGVPFIIIADEKFEGFSSSDTHIKDQLLKIINSEYQKKNKIDKYLEYKKAKK